MTDTQPRRMKGPVPYHGPKEHEGEHDWRLTCDPSRPCTPIPTPTADTQPRRMMRGMEGNEGRHAGDHPLYANCKYNGCTPIEPTPTADAAQTSSGLDALVKKVKPHIRHTRTCGVIHLDNPVKFRSVDYCTCGAEQAIRSVLERAMEMGRAE